MAEILYAPDRERVVTTNAWAFLHWLRTMRSVDLPDWAALQRWSVADQAAFGQVIAAFARLPDTPVQLADCAGRLSPSPPDSGVAKLLEQRWPPATLIRPMAELLLHADLRPDDRLLVCGPAWPWLAALLERTAIILAAPTDLLATAAAERATVLVVPAQALAEAAFQRPRHRPDLRALRTIIATGGPLSPEGRRRIYTWVKADLMLLARTGDTFWGNPLEPVRAQPQATPAFLTPPPSAPAPR